MQRTTPLSDIESDINSLLKIRTGVEIFGIVLRKSKEMVDNIWLDKSYLEDKALVVDIAKFLFDRLIDDNDINTAVRIDKEDISVKRLFDE